MPAKSISHRQQIFQNVAFIALSLVFLPIDTFILLTALIYRKLKPCDRPETRSRNFLDGIMRGARCKCPTDMVDSINADYDDVCYDGDREETNSEDGHQNISRCLICQKKKRTILVSSTSMTKGLAICRAFHRCGHRVIGADINHHTLSSAPPREPTWMSRHILSQVSSFIRQLTPVSLTSFSVDRLSPGRFSAALAEYYTLPSPVKNGLGECGLTEFSDSVMKIIRREKVDLWICVSGVNTTLEECIVAGTVERETSCRVFQLKPQTAEMLHGKDTFIQKTKDLGLTVPESHIVTSRAQVMDHLYSKEATNKKKGQPTRQVNTKQYIMKCIPLDDLSRADLTLFPRPGGASATEEHLSALDITTEKPWLLQEFITGFEYCTHAVVINGLVRDFVACKSAELLMHYQPLLSNQSVEYQKMLEFTEKYARELEGGRLTGHVSFDFIAAKGTSSQDEKSEDTEMYPIECNPRAHTAALLCSQTPEPMTEAYLKLLEPTGTGTVSARKAGKSSGVVEEEFQDKEIGKALISIRGLPSQFGNRRGYYWIGHDLCTLVLLPLSFCLFNPNKETMRDLAERSKEFIEHVWYWKEAVFDMKDPVPWWWMYHVYWPAVFLDCLVKGRKWSRVNISTGRVFECL